MNEGRDPLCTYCPRGEQFAKVGNKNLWHNITKGKKLPMGTAGIPVSILNTEAPAASSPQWQQRQSQVSNSILLISPSPVLHICHIKRRAHARLEQGSPLLGQHLVNRDSEEEEGLPGWAWQQRVLIKQTQGPELWKLLIRPQKLPTGPGFVSCQQREPYTEFKSWFIWQLGLNDRFNAV